MRAPEHVVPLSIRDQDTLLALGVIPLAVRDGFYAARYPAWPWVREPLGDRDPPVLPEGELNFEQVAALGPDLVVGAGAGITQREYEILSQIAPTLAQSARYVDYGTPWQEITRTVGRAVCRGERAETEVAAVEARVAATRERHRVLAGATAVVAVPGGGGGSFWVYGPEDSRSRFLLSVGMRLPEAVATVAGKRFAVTISSERLDLLDADVVIWLATPAQRAALRHHPIYQRLGVARDGREVFLDWNGLFTAAMTNTSALSMPFLLEALVPRIVDGIEGRAAGRIDA